MNITTLQPQSVWHYFYQLTQIPRPSHQEEAVQQYVLTEAGKLNLACERDAGGNIIVRKPASSGRENEAGVILQGHLDMVPQKNNDTVHDFSKDPITAYIDGDWVKATGTTLGADNGIGVAMILSVLADNALSHPPLEALFTASEETGMNGAKSLQAGKLNGQYLLNLDYEEEGELCIGCAGGVDGTYRISYQTEPCQLSGYSLRVGGLRGGHSGVEIHTQRGNAVKILARILTETGISQIAEITGGNLRNAIPREAQAKIALEDDQADALQEALKTLEARLKQELTAADQNLNLQLEKSAPLQEIITPADSRRLLDVLRALPNGVDRMSITMPGLTETSVNLAAVYCENGIFHIHCLLRSSNDDCRQDLAERMSSVIRLAGGETEYSGEYPGWQPQPDAPLVKMLQHSGERVYGHLPEIKAIHAGLECGILSTHYPHWQMAAFGPTIESPHSPNERVNIASVERSYRWLCTALENRF